MDSGEPKILISVPAMLVVALLKDVPHSIDLHDVVDVIMILLILLEFEYHIPEDRLVFTLLLPRLLVLRLHRVLLLQDQFGTVEV